MTEHDFEHPENRRAQLEGVAKAYVLEGLGCKDFDAIPYHPDVTLRAPLCPGGSARPVEGKDNLRKIWWAPLLDLIGAVRLQDVYVNLPLTSVTVEFHCDIRNPACTLRICDRFAVDPEGYITEQENFFDPRDVTQPGWGDG